MCAVCYVKGVDWFRPLGSRPYSNHLLKNVLLTHLLNYLNLKWLAFKHTTEVYAIIMSFILLCLGRLCVTIAIKMRILVKDIQVQILGVVAKIQVRSLRTEVRQGSIRLLCLALGELILSLKRWVLLLRAIGWMIHISSPENFC